MSTISTTINHGIVVGTNSGTGTYASPLTITATGAVVASSGDAVYAPLGYSALTVVNEGTISSATGDGVDLRNGGYVNNAGGLINGALGVGVYNTAGVVANDGTIAGAAGASGIGVYFAAGGVVGNTGLITGNIGVSIDNAVGTVTNSGIIEATGSRSPGVGLHAGGSVDNVGTAAVIRGYSLGIYGTGGAVTVANSGTIESLGSFGDGIDLAAGGIVDNVGIASLIEGGDGVVSVVPGTVTNAGTIDADYVAVLLYGGSVDNIGTGSLIQGNDGVSINNAAGAITNSGTIEGQAGRTDQLLGIGVDLSYGGSVDNEGAASLITNFFDGVLIFGGGTVTNSGIIEGTEASFVLLNGTPLYFPGVGVFIHDSAGTVINFGMIEGTGSAKSNNFYFGNGGVVLYAGGKVDNSGMIEGTDFGVAVYAGATVTNSGTIQSTGKSGAGIALRGGDTIINYGSIGGAGGTAISLGTGGNELVVIEAGSSLQGVIADLLPGDEFDLPFMTFSTGGTATVISNGTVSQQLQVVENGATFTIALDPNQNFSSDIFQLGTDSGTGTLVTVQPCFCRGARILTVGGEIQVEELAIGNRVMTMAGKARRIKWIGRRSYSGRFALGQKHILPVCVAAGALADGVPHRDLWLSPNHALYLDGVLIEVRDLINGVSIAQVETVETVEYFHIELNSHDVLVAEGAPVESYIDEENRSLFHNAQEYRALYPEAQADPARYCAPRYAQGVEVQRVRARIANRAGLAQSVDRWDVGTFEGNRPWRTMRSRVHPS